MTVGSSTGVAAAYIAVGHPGPGRLLLPAAAAALVLSAVMVVRRMRLARRSRIVVVTAAALAGALLAGAATVPVPARTPAGLPLAVEAAVKDGPVSVLVVPNRPGPNLVAVGAPGAFVGTDPARLAPGRQWPGGTESWAEVDLPPGRSALWVSVTGSAARIAVDTGPAGAPAAPAALHGPDGPECAGAALGTLIAGVDAPLTACPSDRLAPSDAAVLRGMVRTAAARGTRTLAVVGDDSPRGSAAAAEVRAAAARAGLAVVAPGTGSAPLVVVAGWTGADAAIRAVGDGRTAARATYLAPWLLNPALLEPGAGLASGAGQSIGLRYSPRGAAAAGYLAALGSRFPGGTPSATGYAAWAGAFGTGADRAPALLYTATRTWVPGTTDHPHASAGAGAHHLPDWLAGGMITPVGGALDET